MIACGAADAAFVDHDGWRFGVGLAQNFPRSFGFDARGELPRRDPMFCSEAAKQSCVGEIFETASGVSRCNARAIGERKRRPSGFLGFVGVPEPAAQSVFCFVGVIDEAVIDKTRDARRAQDIAESLAQLRALLRLHRGVYAVDAVFGELNFPSMAVVWVVFSQPPGEHADISERNDAVVAVVVCAEGGVCEVGRV